MRTGRIALDLNLSIQFAKYTDQSLRAQLTEQLREAILDGRLAAGTRLPSTRSLAEILMVSRTVTVGAYGELFAEGYLEGRHGSGTYVAEDLDALERAPFPEPLGHPRWLCEDANLPDLDTRPSAMIAFTMGVPSLDLLPMRVWHNIWRSVGNEKPPSDYGDPAGSSELCVELANYLGRARGVVCRAEDIIVTSGTVQALNLIAQATLMPGDTIAFEEPGYSLARQLFQARGACILPVPVDDDGMRISELPGGAAAPLLVYVTPSHQYPLASRLSIGRRMALLKWAEEQDSLIIEDDYDSEFRFHAPPLPALAGLDKGGHVAYIGTFSKVLTPSLRLAYLVAPAPLRERIVKLKRLMDYHTSWPVQRAMTLFLAEGHLDRHIRRMRHHYAEKRKVLGEVLAEVAPLARLQGLDAGLHAYLELRSDLDPHKVARAAYERGVFVTTLDKYYYGTPDRRGLLLGYGGLKTDEIIAGANVLVDILRNS